MMNVGVDGHTRMVDTVPIGDEAIRLYFDALIASIAHNCSGFVDDRYLRARHREPQTTTAVQELTAAGVWVRRPGGYFVVENKMATMTGSAATDQFTHELWERTIAHHAPSPTH